MGLRDATLNGIKPDLQTGKHHPGAENARGGPGRPLGRAPDAATFP